MYNFSSRYGIALGVSISLAVLTTVGVYLYQTRKKWKKVGNVTKLYVHPVKSMRGILSQEVLCTKGGIRMVNKPIFDRSFLVIQSSGNMLTARQEPLLVTISIELEDGFLILSAPKQPSIKIKIPQNSQQAQICKVWGEEVPGIDCGDEVAQWLKDYLQDDLRLVYHPPQNQARRLCAREEIQDPKLRNDGKIFYHDSTPCHLLSEASLHDLNDKLAKQVTERSFRPNLLMNGCSAFEEDIWTFIKIGDVQFQYVRDTFRCVLTTVDPDTGVKNPDGNPLATLKAYREVKPDYRRSGFAESPPFGVSLAVVKEGRICVGDPIYAC